MHTRYAPVRHSHGPEGPFTVRLACIRPAASVHPEPGSNSSLYYCLSFVFTLNLGFRLDVLFGVPFLKVPCLAPLPQRRWSCAGLRLSKNFAFSLPSRLSPRSFRKRVQKYNLFSNWQHLFSKIFHFSLISLITSLKNFLNRKNERKMTPYY